MADIKMEFNGNVSIGKMFDIHDNQQVKVHYNGYSEDKEKQSQSQKKISEEEKVLKSASHINGNLNGSKELEHYAS